MSEDFRWPIGLFGLIVLVSTLATEALPKMFSAIGRYSNHVSQTPIIERVEDRTEITASPNLSGYFPLRGYDLDNDGRLDYAKLFMHCAPRVPFGRWKKVSKEDPLFTRLQQEYEDNLRR